MPNALIGFTNTLSISSLLPTNVSVVVQQSISDTISFGNILNSNTIASNSATIRCGIDFMGNVISDVEYHLVKAEELVDSVVGDVFANVGALITGLDTNLEERLNSFLSFLDNNVLSVINTAIDGVTDLLGDALDPLFNTLNSFLAALPSPQMIFAAIGNAILLNRVEKNLDELERYLGHSSHFESKILKQIQSFHF